MTETQVVLKTDDDAYGVSLGTDNNTTTDMSALTKFNVAYVDADNAQIVLYDPDTGLYLSIIEGVCIRFESESVSVLSVDENAALTALSGNTSDSFGVYYDSMNDRGIYLTSFPYTNDVPVLLYAVV